MMGRFRSTQFLRDDLFASPLAEGERMKVRGSNELALKSILTLPLSFGLGEATPYARCRANLLRQT